MLQQSLVPQLNAIVRNRMSPRAAILISFMLAYLGFFLPWGQVTVRRTPDLGNGQDLTILVWGEEVSDVNHCWFPTRVWASDITQWVFTIGENLLSILRICPLYFSLMYVSWRVKKSWTFYIGFFIVGLLLGLIPVFAIKWFEPSEILCNPTPELFIKGVAIYWPTLVVLSASIGLGFYAMSRPVHTLSAN